MGILWFFWGALRSLWWTACYWIVGLTPEEYLFSQGRAWMDAGWHRRAIMYFRRYLDEEDWPTARAQMAWCYSALEMVEPALKHFRIAYQGDPSPTIGIQLAALELEVGNVSESRSLFDKATANRDDVPNEIKAFVEEMDSRLAAAENSQTVG